MVQYSKCYSSLVFMTLPLANYTDWSHFHRNPMQWVETMRGGKEHVPKDWQLPLHQQLSRYRRARALGVEPQGALNVLAWVQAEINTDPSILQQCGFQGRHLGHLILSLRAWSSSNFSLRPFIEAGVDFSTPDTLKVYPMQLFVSALQEAVVKNDLALIEAAPTLLSELLQAISDETAKNPPLPSGQGCLDVFLDELAGSDDMEDDHIQALLASLEHVKIQQLVQKSSKTTSHSKRL